MIDERRLYEFRAESARDSEHVELLMESYGLPCEYNGICTLRAWLTDEEATAVTKSLEGSGVEVKWSKFLGKEASIWRR